MFEYNPFKKAIIRAKVPDGATCTAYRCCHAKVHETKPN